jgi:3-phenylpropionate/cinnamic acid dioxygenase small subunit
MKSSNWKTVLMLGVGLVAVNQGAAFAQSTSNPASIAARLQAVEDQAAVEKLITSDYSTALDTQDWNAFGALFTADADFRLYARQFPPREFKGNAAIQRSMIPPSEPAGALPSNGYSASLKHVITNPHVQLDGDRATATAYWMEVALDKNLRPSVVSTGHYRDVLKRDNGRWKFQIRDVFAYDMAPVAKGRPAASPTAPTAHP